MEKKYHIFKQFRPQILTSLIILWLALTISGLIVREVVWNHLNVSLEATGTATELEGALNRLFADLEDAETSQRGYLLTGDESFLNSYKNSGAALPGEFDQLAIAAAQDPPLENEVLKLRGLAELKMAEMQDTVQLRQEKKSTEALALVNGSKGRELMNQIRAVNWEMRQRQLKIFSNAWAGAKRNLQWAQDTSMVLGFLGFGAGLLALYLLRTSFVQERARRKLMEEKLGAEKIVLEKSAFLANMSHEIRTPMNAILGFGELLEGETLTPKQAQYVNCIRQSGTSLLQLINDVLDLSKLESGRLELHLEPTDLRGICSFLQTMFGQQAAIKKIQLQFEAGDVPPALLLDRLRLRQTLVNLVGNALKFTPQGQVTLRVAWEPQTEDRSRGNLLIEVADTGVGISPETQQEIFKPFVQSSPHRDLEQQGTGLGLSIVQRLTQMMDGTVSLESTPGVGSVFRLKFPDVSVSARLPVNDLAQKEGAIDFDDFPPFTVLVVDDNATNRDLMTGFFEGTHHRLRLAGNGAEALASIAEVKPTLMLLDIRMPVMDGRATLAAIRRIPGMELLPIIAVTASSRNNDEKELRSHFSGYLRKPFSRQLLYQELAQFLPKLPRRQAPAARKIEVAASNTISLMATARSAATPEAALAELKRLQQNLWPGLRDGMGINETTQFAHRLHRIAQTMQSHALMVYADRLAANAQAYAVADMERSLAEFPALVSSLELPRDKP